MSGQQKPPSRPNICFVLARRLSNFPVQIWRNLGTNWKYRWPKCLGYAIGSVGAAYSALSLFYSLNIELRELFYLPFHSFFLEQVVPFLAQPFVYVGIDFTIFWKVILTMSAIGGAVLANAEFRTRFRFTKHLFIKRESGPEPDFTNFENPGLPDPPRSSILGRLGLLGIALLLGYSFIGLIGFIVFVPIGLWFLWRDIVYVAAFVASQIVYVFEHFLAPFERWGEDDYWGTKWFLKFYRVRKRLDEFFERSRIEFWRVSSLDPKLRNWTAAQNTLKDGGRVIANAIWLLLLSMSLTLILNREPDESRTSAWRATADPPRVQMIHSNSNPCPASSARSRSAVPHA